MLAPPASPASPTCSAVCETTRIEDRTPPAGPTVPDRDATILVRRDVRRVAYVIDTMSCDTAGTQKQLLQTIQRLDRARFDPILVCLWSSAWMETAKLPCETFVLGHRGFLKPGFPAVVRRLGALLDDRRIDLVQVFFDEAIFVTWLGALLSRRRPVLVSSRRDMGLGSGNQPWYHRLFPRVLKVANRDFAAIITNAECVSAYAAHRERTPAAKFIVVRNGVDLPEAVFAPLELPGGHPAVGMVASLTPVKRHDILLAAWAQLVHAGRVDHGMLHLLGDGPLREGLERLAFELGIRDKVHFHGAVTDVTSRLASLDIGILCSDREGLSNAILEYMAAGLPVVATRVGGNPELVDEANGQLVPAADAPALASAISYLMGDESMRTRLGLVSRNRVAEIYSWDRSMSALMDLYDRLLADASRAGADRLRESINSGS